MRNSTKHVHCESVDDQSENENTLVINMLRIEHEIGTPIEASYYQNENPNSEPQEPKKNWDNIYYTPHIVKKLKI